MSDITDVATLAIALAALGVSLHELRAAGKERRISVRPSISFRREASSEKRTFRLVMRNSGIGPAEITELNFMANNKKQRITRSEDFNLLLKSVGINECHIDYAAYITPGDIFPVDAELRLIELSAIEIYPEIKDPFDSCFARLSVQVVYRSLYGEQFSASADFAPST